VAALPARVRAPRLARTPLVLSVHKRRVVDFAMASFRVASTLFPFFVDGAIFSGFAMVLILLLRCAILRTSRLHRGKAPGAMGSSSW